MHKIIFTFILTLSLSAAAHANGTQLLEAAAKGNLSGVQARLSAGDNANATDIVSVLLKKGANLHLKNTHGATALMAAAFEGHVQAVRALLRGGADVAIEDKDGVTALMWARAKGHTAVVQELERVGNATTDEHR